MCYHISLTATKPQLEDRFTAELIEEYDRIYHGNGFAHKPMPVITAEEPDKIQLFHWGLIPHWFKPEIGLLNKKTGEPVPALKQAFNSANRLNAKGEEMWDKPSYKMYADSNRCLVLADAIIETHWDDPDKPTKKWPHKIFLKNKDMFALGGVYSFWTDPETGRRVPTFTVVTTDAVPGSLMYRLHNSMKRTPLIMPRRIERNWIEKNLSREEIVNLIQPLENELLTAHPISPLVFDKKLNTNVPEAIEPYEYEGFAGIC